MIISKVLVNRLLGLFHGATKNGIAFDSIIRLYINAGLTFWFRSLC